MIIQHKSDQEWTPTFEISLVIRDAKGNPTGRRKEYSSSRASDISNFWVKNNSQPTKKKKTKAATSEEASQILKEINQETIVKESHPDNVQS